MNFDFAGAKFGEFLGKIKWREIASGTADTIMSLLQGLSQFVISSLKKMQEQGTLNEIGGAVADFFNKLFEDPEKWKDIGLAIRSLAMSLLTIFLQAVQDFDVDKAISSIV